MTGFVSLVGAGPGDPELLTRAAVVRLRKADLVLYDALVEVRVLAIARRARRFFVGKRAGCHSITEEAIIALMIRAARRGRRVVRLKGGDPFVFGRGGEEALALRSAGVPYEVLPGITSAVAAPALAGIPVTHRGLAAGFVVVTGHDDASLGASLRAIAPNALTLVILMAAKRVRAVADLLIASGWRRDTPAAVVTDASRPGQASWRGTVESIADAEVDPSAAGTIVVGDVAALDLRCAAAHEPRMSVVEMAGREDAAAQIHPGVQHGSRR